MNDGNKRSKARAKYWTEKGGILYARLQYTDETGKRREKYRRIPNKSAARSKLEEMRHEVFLHGPDTLHSDRMTFLELANEYERARVFPAIYSNGIKVAGRRSVGGTKTHLAHLKLHFGKKLIRQIKIGDIESYKILRASTPVSTEVSQVNPHEIGEVIYSLSNGFGKSRMKIGLIAPVTNAFCSACTRIRLTADGKIRTCLFSAREYELRTLLRSGGTRSEIVDLIQFAVANKEPGHTINTHGFKYASRTMSAIGG